MSEDKPIMLTSPKEIEIKDKLKFSAEEIQKQIRNKKEFIVKQRLKELGKLNVLKDIAKRRFPKLMIEQYKDKEVVWVDNGTLKGLKLVTFYLTEPEIKDGENGDSNFSSKLLYD